MSNNIHHGSCFCKSIKFEVTSDPWAFSVCHCFNCKKVTGSAFMSNVLFKPEHHKFTTGEDLLTHYRDSAADSGNPKILSFCSKCGTPLSLTNDGDPKWLIVVPSGAFDGDIPWDPTSESFANRKAKWLHEITFREDGCITKTT